MAAAPMGTSGHRHVGDIAQRHLLTFATGQHDAAQGFGGGRQSLDLNGHALVGVLDEAGPRHPGRLAGGGKEILDRQAMLAKTFGIGLDLQLANFTAEHIDIGDARHGEQSWREGPVDQIAQGHEIALSVAQTQGEHGGR